MSRADEWSGVNDWIRSYTIQWGLPCYTCPKCGGISSFESGGASTHKCHWQKRDADSERFFQGGIERLFSESFFK